MIKPATCVHCSEGAVSVCEHSWHALIIKVLRVRLEKRAGFPQTVMWFSLGTSVRYQWLRPSEFVRSCDLFYRLWLDSLSHMKHQSKDCLSLLHYYFWSFIQAHLNSLTWIIPLELDHNAPAVCVYYPHWVHVLMSLLPPFTAYGYKTNSLFRNWYDWAQQKQGKAFYCRDPLGISNNEIHPEHF